MLLAATIAALVWANAAPSSYDDFWHMVLSVRVGGGDVAGPADVGEQRANDAARPDVARGSGPRGLLPAPMPRT